MATGQLHKVIGRLLQAGALVEWTDSQLLERFIASRDETAFTELVRRHGPMVLRVCQRVLQHATDAEDAFQATFIVLARKAGSIAKQNSIGSWLYGVAYRVSLRARATSGRRRAGELPHELADRSRSVGGAQVEDADVHGIVDEEISHLPEIYRSAIVLCYLQGKTVSEAARGLCCPRGTVLTRLSRGRDLLRDRLAGRGVSLPVLTLAAWLSGEAARAAVPVALASSTARGAAAIASGQAAGFSTKVLALAEASLRAGSTWKLKAAAAVVLGLLVLSVGAWTWLASRESPSSAAVRLDSTDHKGTVWALAVSPDGKLIASGGRDGTVKLRDRATGQITTTLTAGAGEVRALAFAPDGTALASAHRTADGDMVRIWDLARGKERTSFRAGVLRDAMHFSPDGGKLVTAAWEGEVKLWDAVTGQERASLPFTNNAPRLAGPRSLAFSSDGQTVFVATTFQGLMLWDVARKQVTPKQPSTFATPITLSADGRTIAQAAFRAQNVQVFDVSTMREACSLQAVDKTGTWVAYVALSPDGLTLVTLANAPVMKIWDVATRRATDISHLSSATALTFSADGKKLITARPVGRDPWTADCQIEVWDVAALKK